MIRTFQFLCLILILPSAASAGLTTNIEYGTADGVSLRLDAYVPNGLGPFPAVILIHGGGWNSGDKAGGAKRALIAPMEDPLGNAGFAWFSINYRLAPRHPYPAAIEDVETAIRWVKAHAPDYRLDLRRLAISGESAGGQLAALATVRAGPATQVAAAVIFYGRYDMLSDARIQDGKVSGNLAQYVGSDRLDDPTTALLRSASSLDKVRPGLPPFLLLHGTRDDHIPYEQAVTMRTKLLAAGVPCDLITIPDGPHGMIYWDQLAPNYKSQVVAWLKRTLDVRN
jgi:alpha-L-fucosidase 2